MKEVLVKNLLLFSLFVSCTSTIILSGDNASSPESFTKFKEKCPTGLESAEATIEIDKDTLKYVGPCTQENLNEACDSYYISYPRQSSFAYCTAIINIRGNIQSSWNRRRIIYDEETSEIVVIDLAPYNQLKAYTTPATKN